MSEKSLSYIAQISNIEPIEGKDRIVLLSFTTNNWKVIGTKEFKIGDKCIYIESDSLLPDIPEFEFLKKRCWSVKYNAHRIKRMNMGGVISEGIVFSFKDLAKHLPDNTWTLPVDSDLTNLLKIRRIEDEVPEFNPKSHKKSWLQYKIDFFLWKLFKIRREVMGINFYDFPGYLVKTDETQSQSVPHIFELMKEMQVYESVKCLDENTEIITDKGNLTVKYIVDNKIKCKVLGFDIEKNVNIWTPILKWFKHNKKTQWYEIELINGQKIKVTEEHPIFLPKLNCYRQVKDLNEDEEVLIND